MFQLPRKHTIPRNNQFVSAKHGETVAQSKTCPTKARREVAPPQHHLDRQADECHGATEVRSKVSFDEVRTTGMRPLGGSSQDLVQWLGSPPFRSHEWPFGSGTTRSLGDLLSVVMKHLLAGMILQARIIQGGWFGGSQPTNSQIIFRY